MDVSALASYVITALAPALPFLLDKAGKAVDSAAEEIGADAWAKAKELWKRVRGKVEEDPAAKGALDKVAENPSDGRRQKGLALQLEELLEGDAVFAAEIQQFWTTTQSASNSGGGAVVQSQGPGMALGVGDHGLAVARDLTVNNYYLTITQVLAPSFQEAASLPDLQRGVGRYLRFLIDSHADLPFRGMGFDDRLAFHLPLLDIYVPGRAHVRAPEGDTWSREGLRLRGRMASPEDLEAIGNTGRPTEVLDLLRKEKGLVLLGDPGAGKSTFLKFLALTAANGGAEGLGLGDRIPLLAPLAAYGQRLQSDPGLKLPKFLAEQLAEQKVEIDPERLLEAGLRRGLFLVLLDGLDEVADEPLCHTVVGRVREFFCSTSGDGNLLVVTSRIVGYAAHRLEAPGLGEGTLVDFDPEEIETFVTHWTNAVERAAKNQGEAATVDAARERKGLLEAIDKNPNVAQLATNPLLLTILALMKRQGVELPERRAELYDKYVRVLIRQWSLVRSLSGAALEGLQVDDTLDVLVPLAAWMQETSGERGMVTEEALLDELTRIHRDLGMSKPRAASTEFLADVRKETLLLIDRGGQRFGFLHLTFQEYLAAVALVRKAEVDLAPLIAEITMRIGQPEWLEVIRLAVGDLARTRPTAAGLVIDKVLDAWGDPAGEAAIFAGCAVFDAGRRGVPATTRERVVNTLVGALRDNRLKAPVRARSGEVLAELGDPRPEVMTLAGMQFCWVPPGPFLMGSPKGDKDAWGDESPQHKVSVDYVYGIARFPVTVAQFAEYVEKSGVERGDPDALRGARNSPVVWVNWQEANAFCEWLTVAWREAQTLPRNWAVRLPSEAEWEKAARGGLEVASGLPATLPALPTWEGSRTKNEDAARKYPWGPEFDPERANAEMAIGRTSAVGSFPLGASLYGVEELSGNVWEWTRSPWSKYPYEERGVPDASDLNSRGVVRGGSFGYSPGYVRCAIRYDFEPAQRLVDMGFRVVVSPFRSGL